MSDETRRFQAEEIARWFGVPASQLSTDSGRRLAALHQRLRQREAELEREFYDRLALHMLQLEANLSATLIANVLQTPPKSAGETEAK